MSSRILITGASGMLGSCLVDAFNDSFSVYATSTNPADLSDKNHMPFDLKSDTYDQLIDWSRPDVIVHCAALTNGNYCQDNIAEALLVNGISCQKLAKAGDSDTKIFYISTDAVFSSATYLAKENDAVFPESVYGKSKELGEFFLRNISGTATSIRTTIVGLNTDKNRRGFVEWIIDAAKNGEPITLFDDVLFTPISIWDLAKEIAFLINNDSEDDLLHVAGSEICTKYEFGIGLLNELNLPTENVKRGKISEFIKRAKRSTDQTLSCGYYQQKYNRKLPSLKSTLYSIKEHYHGNKY